MGHRASVAYVREDDTVQAHYSHWGALDARIAFGHTLTREAPYGAPGEAADRQRLLESLTSEERSREVFDYENLGGDRVGDIAAAPYDSFPDLEAWAKDGINFLHHEAAYVVDPRGVADPDEPWPVRAFDTAWYKGPEEESSEWGHSGILVELYDSDEWGRYAYGTDEDPAPDNKMTPQSDWVDAFIGWLGEDAERVPSFSPLPEDNRA